MRRWMNVLRTPLGLAATVLTVGVLVLAVVAPILWTDEANAVDTSNILAAPSADHWAGTDNLGRDILSRMLVATRLSVELALLATALAVVVGLLLGSAPYLLGRRAGRLVSRRRSTSRSPSRACCSRCSSRSSSGSARRGGARDRLRRRPGFARLTQTLAAGVAARDFVSAARVAGLGRLRILFRHVLPNVAEPLVVNATIGAGGALLSFAGLSFLGLGVQSAQLRLGPAPLRRHRLDLRQPGRRARPRHRRAARGPRVQPVRRDGRQGLRGAARRRASPLRATGDERLARDRDPAGGDATTPSPTSSSTSATSRSPSPAGRADPPGAGRELLGPPGRGGRRGGGVGVGQVAHRARDLEARRRRRPRRRQSARAARHRPAGAGHAGAEAGCSAPRWPWCSRTR